jgi:hypothetical protein
MCKTLLAPRPVRKVKPGLVEPELRAVHCYSSRSTSGATTPYELVGTDDWRRFSAASDLQRVGSRERKGLCWLPSISVLKRDGVHPRISPLRSVFSRFLPRVPHPAGRSRLSSTRRPFLLFPKCHPLFGQVGSALIRYTKMCQ